MFFDNTYLFNRFNIPSMRWKATVIVRLFHYMSFIWSVKSLKMKNWKHYSMKIVVKHKKRAHRIFGSHSSSHFKTFKSSRIHSKARKLGSTWTQAERRWKAVLHVRNAAGMPQKEVIFTSDCYWWWKMDPLRQPQAQ